MTRDAWGLILGWGRTFFLMETLWSQVYGQYRLGRAEEISPVLFIGQCAASIGFLAYSALVGSLVFVVSNALILATALVGEWVRRRLMRRQSEK